MGCIGLDLAKNQGTGGERVGRLPAQTVARAAGEFFAAQPPCLVAMEACASAHRWARTIGALGQTVKLIPPAYVRPFVKRQKNDAATFSDSVVQADANQNRAA